VSENVTRKCPLETQLSTPYTDPIPEAPPNLEIYLFIISRFLDHMTNLHMLLPTWDCIVVEVIIN